MIARTDARLAHSFMHEALGLHWSEDFRGVLHVPTQYLGLVMKPHHVGVAIGFNAFVGRTCAMHLVVQRPECFTRAVIRGAFNYVFNVCGCEAALALVDAENDASRRLCERIGFRETARIPNGGPVADLIVMQLLRADCRWLPKPH